MSLLDLLLDHTGAVILAAFLVALAGAAVLAVDRDNTEGDQ